MINGSVIRAFVANQTWIPRGTGGLQISTDAQGEGMGGIHHTGHSLRRQMIGQRLLRGESPDMQILQRHCSEPPRRCFTHHTDADAESGLQQRLHDHRAFPGPRKDQHMLLAIPPSVHQDGAHRSGRG